MSKRIFQTLLFSLLLCSQLAVLAHDIDHQSIDHTEICKIYYSADAPLHAADTPHWLDATHATQLTSFLANVNATASVLLSYSPRAPPLNS